MEINDNVVLVNNIEGVHMFPLKYQLPDTADFKTGVQGIVEEVFPSGAGIVRFGEKRVLIFNLENKVVKI